MREVSSTGLGANAWLESGAYKPKANNKACATWKQGGGQATW